MKLAVVHQLPVEIYPPTTNALGLFSRQPGWRVRVWSSRNRKGLPTYAEEAVAVRRPAYPGPEPGSLRRFVGFLGWHLRVAWELARWRPDVVLSVEPHSALAVWLYYRVFRGRAALLIHHHEYYAPADFLGPNARTARICHHFEQADLFARAVWVSQTNEVRLQMMQADSPAVTPEKGRLWPNLPPRAWVDRAAAAARPAARAAARRPLRLVHVGSLSFEDTFVREVVTWVAARPGEVTLHVSGYNVRQDVWDWIAALGAGNVTVDPAGCPYDALPLLLPGFDVALVLYKGNTVNFVHNVPNKVFEALACGLEVWYPPEMAGMHRVHGQFPGWPLREVNFRDLNDFALPGEVQPPTDPKPFTAESAAAPLLNMMRQLGADE